MPPLRMASHILVELKSNRESVPLEIVANLSPIRAPDQEENGSSKQAVMRGPQFSHGICDTPGGTVAASASNERRWVTIVMYIVMNGL